MGCSPLPLVGTRLVDGTRRGTPVRDSSVRIAAASHRSLGMAAVDSGGEGAGGSPAPYPDATHEQGAVLIWRVGSKHVTVVRDRWHDAANRDRSMSPAEESASMLQHGVEADDYRGCTSDKAVRPHPLIANFVATSTSRPTAPPRSAPM